MQRTLLFIVAAASFAGPAVASQPETAHRTESGEIQLQSGSIELARLVDLASQRLGVRLTYEEQTLKSTVTLRLPKALTDRELWDLTNRLLAEQGLVTARIGGVGDPAYSVVKIPSAAQLVRAEPYRVDAADDPERGEDIYPPSFRKLSITLSHVPVKDAAAAVSALLSKPGGSVSEEPATRALTISDLRAHAEAAAAAAVAIDVPLLTVVISEYVCRNITPAQLLPLATQIMSKRDSMTSPSTSSPASPSAGGRSTGELVASPDGRGLLVLATPDRIDAWLDLLNRLDQRESVEARRYNAGAIGTTETARLIEQAIAASRAAHPTGAAADDRWSVLPDESTGTLLVTGTAAQHALVEQTLSGLAAAPPETRRPLKTFTLRHRNVREVIGIIERLVDVGMLDAGLGDDATPIYDPSAPDADTRGLRPVPPQPKASGSSAIATIANAPAESPLLQGMTAGTRRVGGSGRSSGIRSERRDALTLTSDEATNMLIAIGEPRVLAQLEMLLPALDVRQPQVMIEAMLVSLTDAQSMALGVELEKIEISGDTIIRLSSLFGLSSAGTGANAGSRVVGDAAGFSGVVLNPGDFSVIIRALETVNQGRSLSVPKVLVNNNQQATFNSTLQQPYASTNASDTVATTSFGGTFDAGTTITVRPQIAEGDHLVLDYQVKLSSFTGSAAGDLPPPRQENSVTSVATIPDGYTVVVGGLEAVTDGEGESRVPGIGAIPIIGELFKNRTTNRSRARFFVFLRANVMRGTAGTGFEELKYLSDRSAGEAGLSDEQSAGGWPELEPRVIR